MPPTLIRVDPIELVFNVEGRHFDQTPVTMQNLTKRRINFKWFTDHTDMYVFQPKSGFIEKSSRIQVMVKLMKLPSNTMAVDHKTLIKARVARDDEVDREKEWRTAVPEDDRMFHIVRMKTRFITKAMAPRIVKVPTVDPHLLAMLRRIERKVDTRIRPAIFRMVIDIARLNFAFLVVLITVFWIGVFETEEDTKSRP